MLAGNIGKFSVVLRQPGEGLSLQLRPMTDDDLRHSAVACGAELDSGPKRVPARKGNAKVTIYNGTDCKLCDGVREGELLGR